MKREEWKEIASSEEGRKWVYEAAELAKKEGLNIHGIENYYWGTIIRFAFPDNPKEEADVYIVYKRVKWLGDADFCSRIRVLMSTDPITYKVQSILKDLAYRKEFVSGYEFDDFFNEFVKKVDTQEDAVAEVKSIIPRVKEVIKKLDEIKQEAEHLIRGIGYTKA